MGDFYNPILDPSRDLSPAAVSRALDQYTYELEDAKKQLARLRKRKADYMAMFDDEIKAQETRVQEASLVLDMLSHDYHVDLTEIVIDIPDDSPKSRNSKKKTPVNDAPDHDKYEIVACGSVYDDFDKMSDEDFRALYGYPIF